MTSTGLQRLMRTPSKGVLKKAGVRSGFEKDVMQSGPSRAKLHEAHLMEGRNELSPGSDVLYKPNFIADIPLARVLARLQEEVVWQQQEITVMGRKVMQPRLVAYMADDPSLGYTYSKTKQEPLTWSPIVKEIKDRIEKQTSMNFNSCLLNLYRDGKDSLSWHSDNEKVYGPEPSIASVSFGERRDFKLRHNEMKNRRYSVSLGGNGDMLLMSGKCQQDWQHSVPKRANSSTLRVNLTFRNVLK